MWITICPAPHTKPTCTSAQPTFYPYATSLFAEYASGVNSLFGVLGGDLPLIRIDTGVKKTTQNPDGQGILRQLLAPLLGQPL